MKTTSTAIALILAASGAAQAQDITHLSYGFTYSETDFGGGTASNLSVDGAVEYTINQFILMASVDYADIDFGPGSFSTTDIKARVGYQISPSVLAYAGFGNYDTFLNSRSSVEAGAQFDNGTIGVALAYRSIDGTPFEAFELAGTYAFSPEASVGVSYIKNDDVDSTAITLFGAYDAGPLSIDASFQSFEAFGDTDSMAQINASYEFGGQFRAMGSITSISPDGNDRVNSFLIGGGYQVANNMWVDASIARTTGDFIEFDTFALALTFETGRQTLITDRTSDIRNQALEALGTQGELAQLYNDYGAPIFGF